MATEPAPLDKLAEETRHAIKDVRVLLEYLGRRADNLLQVQFEDTRADLSVPMRRAAVPPCRTYKHFLTRFVAIESRFPDLRPMAEAPSPNSGSPPEGDEGLTDLAFLYLSRDFLAAVAAPATVNSIQITNAYLAARRHSLFSQLWLRLRGKGPSIAAADFRPECEAGARRLASRVVLTEFFALLGTALTLIVSVYALAGHLILDSQRQIVDQFTAIRHDMEELAKDLSDPSLLLSPVVLASLCDPAADRPQMETATMKYMAVADPQGATAPATAPTSKPSVMNLRACGLYWRSRQNTENVAAVTLHMMSWTHVAISDLGAGEVFGLNPSFLRKTAEQSADLCRIAGLPLEQGGHCGLAPQQLPFRTREVADGLLGCITLYLLPTLYGGLGAMAATLRALRRKVDQSLVTMTDRGRVQQDVILGVLCGAVIGLFSGYLGASNPQQGLGLSALALLAGYNISGVFAFLDELSSRVFQPAPAGNASNRPG